jgi:hypothetical protein
LFGIKTEAGELKIEKENDPQKLQQFTEAVFLYFHKF